MPSSELIMADNDDNDDDLYGDLEATDQKVAAGVTLTKTEEGNGKDVASSVNSNTRSRNSNSNSSRPRSLVEEVDVLQQHVTELHAENETLKRNMGTLYRTAVAELARKDKQIAHLQAQLDEREQQQQQQQHAR